MDAPILLVDSDTALTRALAARLRSAGLTVDVEADGAAALARTSAVRYACVVTELDVPSVPGLELCRRLRAQPETSAVPIIVLSTRADEIDRVVAFEVGVDDYVVKPCSWRELTLRIRARLRPARPAALVPPPFRFAGMEFDLGRFRVSVDGVTMPLTNTEVALLVALVRRGGAVATREYLLYEVWELPSGEESRTLDSHMRRLREKLGPAGERVQTVRGTGYRLVSADPSV
jgi:two-component system phosphate regulon response regulator PhoB